MSVRLPSRPGRKGPRGARGGDGAGFAMVLVLIAVALAVVLGVGYVSSATIRALAASNSTQANRAHYLAESGIQHAMEVLWNQPALIESSSYSNRLGPYYADDTDDSYVFWGREEGSGLYTLFCQATCGGISQAVAMQVFRTPPYDEQLLGKNPQGYWRLGESSGSVVEDVSGHDYDLTAYGNPGWGQPGAIAADADTGMHLDGADDYMYRPPTLGLKIEGDLTVSIWFKVDDMPSDLVYLLTYSEDGENPLTNAMYEAVLNPEGSITFMMEYGAGHDIVHTFTDLGIQTDRWHNLAVTRSQGTHTLTVFVDGQAKGSWDYGSPGPPQANTGKNSGLYVGSAYGDSNFFEGWMDDIAVLDRPLTAAEIQALYEAANSEQVMQVRQWEDAPTDLGQ